MRNNPIEICVYVVFVQSLFVVITEIVDLHLLSS